jgi:hypothetical protein
MFRFTIRDVLWLTITAIASFATAVATSTGSWRQGYERGKGENIELIEAKYNLERAKACLKKHGLEPGCAEE